MNKRKEPEDPAVQVARINARADVLKRGITVAGGLLASPHVPDVIAAVGAMFEADGSDGFKADLSQSLHSNSDDQTPLP